MYEMDKAKFGAFVAQLRKEQGVTQKDLAQKLYISDKAVSKWETGVNTPDVALLIPLAELLGRDNFDDFVFAELSCAHLYSGQKIRITKGHQEDCTEHG